MYRRLLLAPLVALLLAIMTSPALALTLDDVKQMVSVGVPDNIIVSTVANSEEVFNLGAEQIIELKTAGVSDKVLEALQATAGSKARTTETRESDDEPRGRGDKDDGAASSRGSSDDDDDGYSRRSRSSEDDDGRSRSSEDDDGSSRRRSRSSRSRRCQQRSLSA